MRRSLLRWFGFAGLFVSISLSMGQVPQQNQNQGGGGFGQGGGGGFGQGGGGGFGQGGGGFGQGGGKGGFGRGGGGGGGGRPGWDPSQLFDMMAKGKSSINRADLDERGQGMFDRYAGGAGITNGVMTRDQFTQAMSAAGGGRGGNRGGGNRGGGGDNPGNAWGGGGWNAPAVDPMESIALAAFRKMDLNGDGVLNYDEMSESLKAEKDKWDTDKNGFIDFNEFKAYLQARMQAVVGDGSEIAGGADPDLDKTEDDKKPIVYRAGKLPKELPSWFAELDTDHDAQVGLYEWKKSGRSLEEFAAMDRNGDGFLTVEEVLHAGRSGVEGASGGRMVAAMGDPGAGDGGVMTMQRNYPPSDSGGARPGGRRPGGPGGNKTRGDNPKGRGGNKDGGGGRNKKGGGGGGGNRGGFDPNDDI